MRAFWHCRTRLESVGTPVATCTHHAVKVPAALVQDDCAAATVPERNHFVDVPPLVG